MTETESQEQALLESKLQAALEEAWNKANEAQNDIAKGGAADEKKLWFAAEAAEYCCLLFSLTHGLENENPPLRETKGREEAELVKESVELLGLIRTGKQEPAEGYRMLRDAAHGLRTVYLARPKKTKGQGSFN